MLTACVQKPAEIRKGIRPFEQDLQAAVSHHMGAWGRTGVFCKSSNLPLLRSHLSRPGYVFRPSMSVGLSDPDQMCWNWV